VFELGGVKFVADEEFSFMIEGAEIVKMGAGFYIADQGGC
jgi:hypothetical protein